MAFYRKSGTTNVAPTTVKRRSGTTWVNVQTIKRRLSGAWVTVWTSFTASANNVNGGTVPVGSTTQNIGTSTCSASGGSGTYTYAWSYVSGDTFTMSSTTSVNCTFSHTNKISGAYVGNYKCVVSDGTSSITCNITVTFTVGQA